MAVPNTNTFTLKDVQTELGGVNDDLIECFANADPVQFDINYSGSKNSLYNFRNYGNVCVRPTGLIQTNLFYQYNLDGGSWVSIYNVSLAYSKSSWDDAVIALQTHSINLSSWAMESVSGSIGDTAYDGLGTDCTKTPDGFYWINQNLAAGTVTIMTISGGIITAIEPYAYTAPDTEAPTVPQNVWIDGDYFPA